MFDFDLLTKRVRRKLLNDAFYHSPLVGFYWVVVTICIITSIAVPMLVSSVFPNSGMELSLFLICLAFTFAVHHVLGYLVARLGINSHLRATYKDSRFVTCLDCGYDLRGTFGEGCPECGALICFDLAQFSKAQNTDTTQPNNQSRGRWIKKPMDRPQKTLLQKLILRFNPITALVIAAVSGLLIFVTLIPAGVLLRHRHPSLISDTAVDSIAIAVFTFIITYGLQVVRGYLVKEKSLVTICNSCHVIKHGEFGKPHDQCDGLLEDFDDWAWEEVSDKPNSILTDGQVP